MISKSDLPNVASDEGLVRYLVPSFQTNLQNESHRSIIYEEKKEEKINRTVLHKAEDYLLSKYEFRFDTISLNIEYREKEVSRNWSTVNDSQLWRELNKRDIRLPLHGLQSLLKSHFVEEYNPLQSYFLQFDLSNCQTDSIERLSEIVILEDNTEKDSWRKHLKKWMIRAVRTVFEPYAINKHAIILVSKEEDIGKSFFCEFLCPNELKKYYTDSPVISQEKDSQISLATNFIINLDELHQLKSNASRLKAWVSRPSIKVRFPYERKETKKDRICSFVGNSNEDDFLHSELGYSRWLCFKIKGTHIIDVKEEELLRDAWKLAYKLYKENPRAGGVSREELIELKEKNKGFKHQSSEQEILGRYISPARIGTGVFMTTTDILQYIQERVGNAIRLNSITLGRAIKECGYERSTSNSTYGYWVIKH